MLEAVRTGSGEGAVIGRSSRRRILRLPAAWWRCGIGLTRSLLGGAAVGSVRVDPICRKRREVADISPAGPDATDHLKLANGPWRRKPAAYAEDYLAMAVTITSGLVEAYSLCPRKAFLLMTGA